MHYDLFIRAMLTCMLVTFVSTGCDWYSPEAKKAKHRERAISYFEKGQYQEARVEFQNLVQIDPNDADAHYRLALTYLKLGGCPNLQLAASELTRTLELDSTNREAMLKLGEAYL